MAELFKTKEDLKQAKDDTTQSWLDSRPLIDKLQTDLSNEKNRATKSATDILELESQLQTTNISIRSKKEEEVKIREMINKINQSSDKIREEMEQLKLETDEERRARSRLKQVLRLRKKTLQALQLTLRAIRIESEAFGASSANAIPHINSSQAENSTVQLTQEEFDALTMRAKEEASLADWRVSVSMEQRFLAEKSRELAQRKLQVKYTDSISRKKKTKDEITDNENIARHAEDSRIEVGDGDQVNSRQNNYTKARDKLIAENQRNSKQQKVTTKGHCRKRNHPFLFK